MEKYNIQTSLFVLNKEDFDLLKPKIHNTYVTCDSDLDHSRFIKADDLLAEDYDKKFATIVVIGAVKNIHLKKLVKLLSEKGDVVCFPSVKLEESEKYYDFISLKSPAFYQTTVGEYVFDDSSVIKEFNKRLSSSEWRYKFQLQVAKPLIDFYKVSSEINSIIGCAQIKEYICTSIIAFAHDPSSWNDYHGICLFGDSGTGKTKIATVISAIYKELGMISGDIVFATRSDLIGEYIGATAVKTKKLLSTCVDGILFIDEAYDLSKPSTDKDYGQEAIVEIIKHMDNNIGKFIVIFAGYTERTLKMMETNEGLHRRFPFQFTLERYTSEELAQILLLMVPEYVEFSNLIYTLIVRDYDSFKCGAGDMYNTANKMRRSKWLYSGEKLIIYAFKK